MARTIENGKWIQGVDEATPLSQAARMIIAARLEPIPGLLRKVVDDGAADGAMVHRLRISTRRAEVALQAFEACFGKRSRKRVARRLRGLRRAAAAARSCDVDLGLLRAPLDGRDEGDGAADAVRYAVETIERRQRRARKAIAAWARDHSPKEIARRSRRLLDPAKAPAAGGATFGDVAAERLSDQVAAALAASDGALDCFEGLHALRIATKRLRYTMELFAHCCDEAFRNELYPNVLEVQERLGSVNDAHELADRLEALASDVESGAAKPRGRDRATLTQALRDRAADERARRDALADQFRRWWPLSGRPSIERAAPRLSADTVGSVPLSA
jgi:CHAD domain-containing protein